MRRAKTPVGAAGLLLALSLTLHGRAARASDCESGRPTDTASASGASYGGAEVRFFDSASARVRVHYALSGPHAPPAASTLEEDVPDAAVVAARAAEDALSTYAELGYLAPLGDADSPCPSNGDSDALDIYLIHFAAADGQVEFDHCESSSPRRCAGFMLVENDFRGGGYASVEEGLRTVVPHELFHLVQNAYDADVERWWAEGTAQWAAKQVYPDLRDLERFLPAYFERPWRPLNVPPNGLVTDFLYATAIWPVFLQERFDADILREVFEEPATDHQVLPVIDQVLRRRDSDLAREFLQFATYNAATGERARKDGYRDAADYPLVPLAPVHGSTGELANDVAAGLGAFYYALSEPSPVALSLDADSSRIAGWVVPLSDGKVELGAGRALPATIVGDAVVVVAGQSLLRTDAAFTLRATSDSGSNDPGASGCGLSRAPQRGAPGVWLMMGAALLARCRASRRAGKGEEA